MNSLTAGAVSVPPCGNNENTGTHVAHRQAIRQQFTNLDGYRWHWQTAGSGPVCLLLHGTGASVHSWSPLIPYLSQRFTTVAIDLPGHAKTETPPHVDLGIDAVAYAIGSLLAHEGIQPQLALGHSAGAAVLARMAMRRSSPHVAKSQFRLSVDTPLFSINGALMPPRGMAGMFFLPLARLGTRSRWLARMVASRATNRQAVERLLTSTGSDVDDKSLARYQQLFTDPEHVAGVLKLMSSWHLDALYPHLPNIENPMHLIGATLDRTIPLRDAYQLETHFKNATLDVVDQVGHLAHEERPDIIAGIVEKYVPKADSTPNTYLISNRTTKQPTQI